LLREKEDKQRKLKERNAENAKLQKERAAKEAASKKAQEEALMTQLDGRLLVVLDQMQQNSTPLEITLQGVELGPFRTQMVAKNLAVNMSLLALDMSRCGLEDNDGAFVAKVLKKNNSLRKLDLEGNLLGPMAASEFGRALIQNTGLKTLNLESNQLNSENGDDHWGLYDLAGFLEHNKTLLSFNIANNMLDEKTGTIFREKLELNDTLIDFDFS
jgi:Ran GTPase-activating protein (RanGAP) involved in mRNA processing and transport